MTINVADYEATVSGPGKFEGEAPWVPYFYELVMDGYGEAIYPDYDTESGVWGDLFRVSSEEAEAFGLTIGHWVLLRNDSQGFCYGTEHATLEEAEAEYTAWS